MYVLKRCCFCCPLRHGIFFFGILNILFSIAAVSCLVITTEMKKAKFMNDSSLEVVTSTVLFSIFGMSVILNILLLIAGCQKDIAMFRLYNYYSIATTLTALVPTFILLSRKMYHDVWIAFFAIAMQYYVIILVNSEVIKLEAKLRPPEAEQQPEEVVDVSDVVTLL